MDLRVQSLKMHIQSKSGLNEVILSLVARSVEFAKLTAHFCCQVFLLHILQKCLLFKFVNALVR